MMAITNLEMGGQELRERLLAVLLYGIGLVLTLALGFYMTVGDAQFWHLPQQRTLVLATITTCALSLIVIRHLTSRPIYKLGPSLRLRLGTSLGVATCGFALLVFVLDLLGVAKPPGYALTAYLIFLLVTLTGQLVHDKREKLRVALVPFGRVAEVQSLSGVSWQKLDHPRIRGADALAADFHNQLTPEWRQFLADCQLSRVPVFHVAAIYERLTGKVSLRYLRDPVVSEVRPNNTYVILKRAAEVALTVMVLPALLPMMLLVALAIRLESTGPVLFWQERVGMRGKTFWLVKFRSMTFESEASDARFASEGDPRITKVGRFIRKFRLDELPQLYNVLAGDMSLIGPRPEQVYFARQFEESIPFYSYRHLVRPGLSGWAQVRDGYAGGAEETKEKLKHDLYYVKNMSPGLDLLIVFLTLRTILTGFGSR